MAETAKTTRRSNTHASTKELGSLRRAKILCCQGCPTYAYDSG